MSIAISDASTLFKKCAPAIRTNISECGSVTLCQNVKPETESDLIDIYTKDGEYRMLEHLFMSHFQIKACGAVQHSLRDFFIANAKITRKGDMRFGRNDEAVTEVMPFVMAEQKRPINNVYWKLASIGSSTTHLTGHAYSGSGIPADVRSFQAINAGGIGAIVYLDTVTAGGLKINTQWKVNTATFVSASTNYILLDLIPQNDGNLFQSTNQTAAQIATAMSGKIAVLTRGVVNVGKTESYCDDEPAYRNDSLVPFWIQHTRWTSCSSSLYQKWLGLVLDNNPLYRERIYIDETERMRQKGEAFENNLFNTLWRQNPSSAFQNTDEYTSLPQITNFLSGTGLGVEGGRCYGYKADAVGWLPQLRECDRYYDAGGAALNIYSIFDAIYNMRRVRAGMSSAAQTRFDVFVDGDTSDLIMTAMIGFFGLKFGGKDRYNQDITSGKNDEYGIQFTSYRLTGKLAGVTLNVITDWAFDDRLSEFNANGITAAGRLMMFLDMTSLYMKVIESNRVNNHTGDLKDLVAVDSSFSCVEATETRDTQVNGLTFTAVVECPQSSLVIENFSDSPIVFAANTQPAGQHPVYDGSDVITPYNV